MTDIAKYLARMIEIECFNVLKIWRLEINWNRNGFKLWWKRDWGKMPHCYIPPYGWRTSVPLLTIRWRKA